MKRSALALAVVTLAVACTSSEYSQDVTDTFVDGDRLCVSGTLNALTYDEIAQQILANLGLSTVVLEDINGSIDDYVHWKRVCLSMKRV